MRVSYDERKESLEEYADRLFDEILRKYGLGDSLQQGRQMAPKLTQEMIEAYSKSSGDVAVWTSWLQTMQEQGREVKKAFHRWNTLPIRDVQLDQAIAEFVVGDFLTWLEENTNLVLVCEQHMFTRFDMRVRMVVGFLIGVVITLMGIGVFG
jgi:hypothetical protein